MQSSVKKRRVTTCLSCYTRKQKCNRQYPCNHCTRRRRPEECAYSSSVVTPPPNALPSLSWGVENGSGSEIFRDPRVQDDIQDTGALSLGLRNVEETPHGQCTTIVESFGYSEESNSNTMALLRMLHPNGIGDTVGGDKIKIKAPSIIETAQKDLGRMPPRQVLDFLVQYFVSQLNWIKQLVHVPSFLASYQKWWVKERPLHVADIEFGVLILRICLYTAQFLPSPFHTSDTICGVSLLRIRDVCAEVGDGLARSCVALDWKGSLVRVQHLIFAAMKSSCEGRTVQFWEGIASASQAAQKAGIHRDSSDLEAKSDNELEKDVRRRVFCSLYVLDSYLSKKLDRVPFLQENLMDEALPRMHLVPNSLSDDADIDYDAPDMFTERLMQVKLARFWNVFGPRENAEYDPTQAGQRYEKFCTEYLPSLPPAFALAPETKWDKSLPKLPMQRHLLHICIFDSICMNFRPLLLMQPSQIASLAPNKQVLLHAQRRLLAIVALKELETISALHFIFNNCHNRFGVIIFNTFEASVLLLAICKDSGFLFGQEDTPVQFLGLETDRLTRKRLMQAAKNGLDRLRTLAEVSEIASSGARILEQLVADVSRDVDTVSIMDFDYESGFSTSFDPLDPSLMSEPLLNIAAEDPFSSIYLSPLEDEPNLLWTNLLD